MINLDMVGRMTQDKETQKNKLEVGGTGTAKQFDAMVDKFGAKYDFKLRKSATGMGPSDHQSFFVKKLPVLFLFTGLHGDYHRPTDTFDKINYEGMASIVDMVEDIGKEVLVMDPRPEFVNVNTPYAMPGREGRRMSGPRLGVMPDYTFSGEAMRIEGVSPGGAAEKIGMKEGDRIVEIAGNPVKSVESYMGAMGKVKPGEWTDITVLRTKDGKDERVTYSIGLDLRIGVTLDYSDKGEGVLVRAVSEAAGKMGVKEGDRIVEIAGEAVKDAQTYAAAMRKSKADGKAELVVVRTKDGKNERVTIKVTQD